MGGTLDHQTRATRAGGWGVGGTVELEQTGTSRFKQILKAEDFVIGREGEGRVMFIESKNG